MIQSDDNAVCRVTLTGPAYFGPSSLLLSLLPWTQPEWRRVTLQMRVGTERCPDWDYANLCMTAIQELITMADGLISDEVLRALITHADVVDIETFRGPPRQ